MFRKAFVWAIAAVMLVMAVPGTSVASPPPSWAVGTFNGYSRELSGDIEVTISASGASSRGVYRGGRRVDGVAGYHQDGKLVFAGARYRLERWNDGIRLTREGESNSYVNCSRGSINQGTVGGFGGSGGSSSVPSWAVGTFSGRNNRYDQDVELSIDRNGSATLRTWTDGKEQTSRGNYRNSRLSFDKASYYLGQRGSGIRITLASNRNEYVDLNRGSGGFGGNGGFGGSGSSSSVPSWAVGTFSGYNNRYDQDVELSIDRNGSATLRTWTDGKEQTSRGSYRNSRLSFDKASYYLSQRGSGIRITLASNRNESVDLNRDSGGFGGSGGSGGSSSSVPSWAVGTFSGYNGRYDQDVELTISRGGSATLRTWTDGREQKSSGSYQSGRLVFDKDSYYLSQRGSGIRITLASNRNESVDLNRGSGGFGGNGGSGGSSSSVPSWAVGAFSGYNSRYDQDVELSIDRNGSATLRTWTDGKEQRSNGSYENGRLVFDKDSFYLSQRGSGIRITLASSRSEYVDLDRRSGGIFNR